MIAIEKRDTGLAELLINNKADLNIKDNHGMSALYKAVVTKNVDLINSTCILRKSH